MPNVGDIAVCLSPWAMAQRQPIGRRYIVTKVDSAGFVSFRAESGPWHGGTYSANTFASDFVTSQLWQTIFAEIIPPYQEGK